MFFKIYSGAFCLPALALVLFSGCEAGPQSPSLGTAPNATHIPQTPGPLSAIWANDGGDKVARDELRATRKGGAAVINSVWTGAKVKLMAAKNEVVSFNLVLESAGKPSGEIKVTFDTMAGPEGFTIRSAATTGNGVFDWTKRDIELFAVRYLEIRGLSRLSYETYDERHVPARLRRPFTGAGVAKGLWADRPDHNKFYPEIAVPLEVSNGIIKVPADENRGVWIDVYVPKKAPAGLFTGKVRLEQAGKTLAELPVELEVRKFTLPDAPTSRTMLNIGYGDIAKRYTGDKYPAKGTGAEALTRKVRDRHFQLAHRHKISLVDADTGAAGADRPSDEWIPRLNGKLFTAENGYGGPGTGVGNGVYSIGTYGTWSWKDQGKEAMWRHADAWVKWFDTHSPRTDYFLYLIDESDKYELIESWAKSILDNPGAGKRLASFATIPLPLARAKVPSLTIAASWFTVGATKEWSDAHAQVKAAASRKFYVYNGKRPSNGSFATEDDGVALRELPWAQYKKGIDRWFFWEGTYYNNYQGEQGETNVFRNANTFGRSDKPDPVLGQSGWNHSNGDGVLFYPGTDKVFAQESLGLEGPLASLRLKHWRRGIQDVDYLALATAADPSATAAIVARLVPKALWDYGVDDPKDPTWVRTDISWPTNPDVWESARRELASIIETKH